MLSVRQPIADASPTNERANPAHRCALCVNAPAEPVTPPAHLLTWQTKCRCGDSNIRHANTERWNNAGACRMCPCTAFEAVAVAA